MLRCIPRNMFLCLLVSFLGATTGLSQDDLTQASLDEHRAAWNELGWNDYEFTLSRHCFCFFEYTRPGLVQVRDGRIAAVRDPIHGLPLRPDRYLTVDALFANLQDAIDSSAESIVAEFDRDLSYPTNMFVDTLHMVADEEYGYSASGLTNELTEIGCDFHNPRPCGAGFIDALMNAVRTDSSDSIYDVNLDFKVNALDIVRFVEHDLNTFFGDSNLDGEFNTADMIHVMRAAEYEDNLVENSTWSTGDWNGDREFDSSDWVIALSRGNYEQGPRIAAFAVPEPTSLWLLFATACLISGNCRRIRGK